MISSYYSTREKENVDDSKQICTEASEKQYRKGKHWWLAYIPN